MLFGLRFCTGEQSNKQTNKKTNKQTNIQLVQLLLACEWIKNKTHKQTTYLVCNNEENIMFMEALVPYL